MLRNLTFKETWFGFPLEKSFFCCKLQEFPIRMKHQDLTF